MADIYNMLRQFGQDVSGAITAGPEARMKTAQFKTQVDEMSANKLRQEAEDKEKEDMKDAREEAIRLVEEGKEDTPEFRAAALRSGESVLSFAKLKALSEKKNKPTRYERNDNFLQNMVYGLNQEFGSLQQKMSDAKDPEERMKYQQESIGMFDSQKKIIEHLQAFDSGYDASFTGRLAAMKDEIMKVMDESRIDLVYQSVTHGLKRYNSGALREVLDDLDENKTELSQYGNTSGIPSSKDIADIARGLTFSGETDAQVFGELLNTRDPEELVRIIEDDQSSGQIKHLAGLILKSSVAASGIGAKLDEEVKKTKKTKKKKKIDLQNQYDVGTAIGMQ